MTKSNSLKFKLFGVILLTLVLISCADGDNVLLRDGTVVSGQVQGIDETSLALVTDDGQTQRVELSEVIYVGFKDWVQMTAQGVNEQRFYDFNAGICIGLPPTPWITITGQEAIGMGGGPFVALHPGQGLGVFIVTAKLPFEVQDEEAMFDEIEKGFEQAGVAGTSGITRVGSGKVTVAGKTLTQQRYQTVMGGVKVGLGISCLQRGNMIIGVVTFAPSDAQLCSSPELRKILDSIRTLP